MRVLSVLAVLAGLLTGCAQPPYYGPHYVPPNQNQFDTSIECKPGGCSSYTNTKTVTFNVFEKAAETRAQAEQGDATAQTSLGAMYGLGLGVPQDYAQAAAWYRKAAEQGYAPAQSLLGKMYHEGAGALQDDKQAVAWWRKAAEQGDATAQNWLGVMYAYGRGVPQDYEKALILWRKSADQGHTLAQNNIDEYNRLVTNGISQPSVGYNSAPLGFHSTCAENGSCYGDISSITGIPKTTHVRGYYRRDGTYVRGHYRSRR